MTEENNIGARESPAQRAAAALESQPPVSPINPVLAQQFSKLLARSPQSGSDAPQQNGAPAEEPPSWNRLKQQGFRFAEKILDVDFARQREEGRNAPREKAPVDAAGTKSTAGTDHECDRTRLLPLMRLGANLFIDSGANELANELAECVRHGRNFGTNWRVEILLSAEQFQATRLFLRCDESALHLRFVCGEPAPYKLLESNVMLLRARLSAVSMRPVIVEIEQASAGDAGREQST